MIRSIDEILNDIDAALGKTVEAQEYGLGDRRVRLARLRELLEYQDRMLAQKARKENKYKSHVLVRFNFPR